MKSLRFSSHEAWRNWRLGKLTGSRVKTFVGKGRGEVKPGIFRAAAESIVGSAILAEDELTASQVLARGHELEPVALERLAQAIGKKVDADLVGWERDDDPRIAYSPDGVIGKTEAAEVKCFLAPKHVEAVYTRRIPENTGGYFEQLIQAFVTNTSLRKMYYCFYHPDFPSGLDFFYLVFTRKELQPHIDEYLALEREATEKVRKIVNTLTLYSPEDIARTNAVKEELLAYDARPVAV